MIKVLSTSLSSSNSTVYCIEWYEYPGFTCSKWTPYTELDQHQDNTHNRIVLCLYMHLLKWLWWLLNVYKANTCWPIWNGTEDDLRSKFTESQTENTGEIQRRVLGRLLCTGWPRKKKTPHIHACMLQNRSPVPPSLLRPHITGSHHFFGEKLTIINPYNLGYFSVTATVHTPTPSPSCFQNGYEGEHKARTVCSWCTYTV